MIPSMTQSREKFTCLTSPCLFLLPLSCRQEHPRNDSQHVRWIKFRAAFRLRGLLDNGSSTLRPNYTGGWRTSCGPLYVRLLVRGRHRGAGEGPTDRICEERFGICYCFAIRVSSRSDVQQCSRFLVVGWYGYNSKHRSAALCGICFHISSIETGWTRCCDRWRSTPAWRGMLWLVLGVPRTPR